MPYKLAEYHGDTLAVPQLVVSHLTQTDGDTIRAALYLLQTGDTDPRTMARALGLSSVEAAKRALQYWAGAGLLVYDRGGAPIPEPEKPQKIDLANLNDPYVAVLCEEAQTAFGKALSRSEMQRLVGLYLTDGWQPDVILLCCAEVARQGRRTIAAVAPGTASAAREAGVETGEDAERYLRRCKQREQWCAEAAEQFGIAADALTRWERRAIARWHEEWGIGARDDPKKRCCGQATRPPSAMWTASCGPGAPRASRRCRPPAGRGSFPAATSWLPSAPRPSSLPLPAPSNPCPAATGWLCLTRRANPCAPKTNCSALPSGGLPSPAAACRHAGRDRPPRRLRRQSGAFCCR